MIKKSSLQIIYLFNHFNCDICILMAFIHSCWHEQNTKGLLYKFRWSFILYPISFTTVHNSQIIHVSFISKSTHSSTWISWAQIYMSKTMTHNTPIIWWFCTLKKHWSEDFYIALKIIYERLTYWISIYESSYDSAESGLWTLPQWSQQINQIKSILRTMGPWVCFKGIPMIKLTCLHYLIDTNYVYP